MPSLHDFLHPTVWGQVLLFGFPTYLGARAFAGRERQLYLTLTVLGAMFSMFIAALAQHDSDDALARVAQLRQTVGRVSGEGAFGAIESGLTTQTSGRLIMWNLTNAPLLGVKLEYSCSYADSPISFSEDVGTIPPNSPVDFATLLPLQTCRAFNPTSSINPPMSAWEIQITTQNGQFIESLLFRRGPGCPMWDWNAQLDRLAGVGYLKDGTLGDLGQDKLLWHTDGWVNQKCSSRSVTGPY